jgi:LPS-assembly lipoprotein
MSSFNRRTVISMAMALSGCGFQPAYDTQGMRQIVGKISYDTPNSRDLYALRNQLERRLGYAASAQFGLSYSTSISSRSAAVSINGQAYRSQIIGTARYALRNLDTQKVITSGSVKAFAGYAPTGSTTSAQAASRDAKARLMTQLGDLIAEDIIFYFGENTL